ncbi:FAD-binding oxidoreductase [Paracoccus sp. DMF-8]|uniref:FAD-binding oxidoreductase n=1 Tax=Paracoccus sp. DMF-8 TaxID=3019445 RepID=UPI0023E35B1E|nr:FAD-binding oxidoreductase [Paracoccus sp. DMF-8]MDF3607645.1 FAD-binding oxidoreductase [Paracoccus sp. DMF-8]
MSQTYSGGLVEKLAQAIGPEQVLTGPDLPESACHDWSAEAPGTPLALVTPQDTAGVSAVLRLCHAAGLPVVPQGRRTGLAGRAVASDGAVLLSLAAMNRIEEIDITSGLMVVRAGCVLQTLQEAAARQGCSFQLDLGARGSAQIGGNIATNAGGNRVIRYGMARDLVLGLEVVQADGTVLPMMNRMPKNNAALDLAHLFIGSEGTLGVITRAVLRLHPGVAGANAALVALRGFDQAALLLAHAQKALSGRVTAFELMWNDYYRAVLAATGRRAPLLPDHPLYALIEMQGADPDGDRDGSDTMLEAAFEAGMIEDAALARSQREVEDFWSLRDGVAEILSQWATTINFDVSVPLARIGDCVDRIRAALTAAFPDLRFIFFGHAGDSNIHLVAGPIEPVDPSRPRHRIHRLWHYPRFRRLGFGRTRDRPA